MQKKYIRTQVQTHTRNRGLQGSATIEAAILMPFVLLLVVTIVFLTLFLHNRLGLMQSAYIAALRGSQAKKESVADVYSTIGQATKETLSLQTLALASYDEKIEVVGNHILVTLHMEQHGWRFATQQRATRLHPIFFIRNCKKLQGLAEGLGAGEEVDMGVDIGSDE